MTNGVHLGLLKSTTITLKYLIAHCECNSNVATFKKKKQQQITTTQTSIHFQSQLGCGGPNPAVSGRGQNITWDKSLVYHTNRVKDKISFALIHRVKVEFLIDLACF